MSNYFHDELAPAIRTVPDWPIEGVAFRDITPLLQDASRYRVLIDTFVHRYIGDHIDVVAGIDARGFILGAPVAYALNTAFTPIRKAGKLPASTASASYTMEYAEATLEINLDAFSPGARILLVDDLIATGGTLGAAVKLIRALEGELVEIAALAKIDALGGAKTLDEQGLRYFTLMDF